MDKQYSLSHPHPQACCPAVLHTRRWIRCPAKLCGCGKSCRSHEMSSYIRRCSSEFNLSCPQTTQPCKRESPERGDGRGPVCSSFIFADIINRHGLLIRFPSDTTHVLPADSPSKPSSPRPRATSAQWRAVICWWLVAPCLPLHSLSPSSAQTELTGPLTVKFYHHPFSLPLPPPLPVSVSLTLFFSVSLPCYYWQPHWVIQLCFISWMIDLIVQAEEVLWQTGYVCL